MYLTYFNSFIVRYLTEIYTFSIKELLTRQIILLNVITFKINFYLYKYDFSLKEMSFYTNSNVFEILSVESFINELY